MPKLSTRKRQFQVHFRDVRPFNHQIDDLERPGTQTQYRRKVSFDEHRSTSDSSLDMDITSSFLNSEYALTPQPDECSDVISHDQYIEAQIKTKRPSICRQSKSSCLMSLDTESRVASVSDDDLLTISISHDARPDMHHRLSRDESLSSSSPDKSFHWGHFIDVADNSPYKPAKRVCNERLSSSSSRFMPYRLPESEQTPSDDLNLAINSITLRD